MSTRVPIIGTLALWLVLSAAIATAQEGFFDLRNVGTVQGDPQAIQEKSAACAGCHGRDGIGVTDMFPSIAGQPAEYLYGRLHAYRPADPPQQPMTAMTQEMTDQEMRDYAVFYAAMTPPHAAPRTAANANDRQQDDRAAALYRHGDRTAGIPPCEGCHGADGAGFVATANSHEYRLYPWLLGQHETYLLRRLAEFRAGKNIHTSSAHIMEGVARNLSAADAHALANWLQDPR